MKTKHLDLGCGKNARNPYNQQELYGVDIAACESSESDTFKTANLSTQPIPFPDNAFNSVSAFDFLEHVPRQIHFADDRLSRLPFIELMNEVWRVLKNDGIFYALTPVFPHPSAFVDPTHVNFITDKTHHYFCGSNPIGRMYGFTGHFEVIRCDHVLPKDAMEPSMTFRKSLRKWHRTIFKTSDLSHQLWILKAIKTNTAHPR